MITCKINLHKICLILVGILACVFFILSFDKYYFPAEEHHHYIYINLSKAVFRTDDEFLSVALDTSFMRRRFHELNDSEFELLAKLAETLSPGYLRLGGTDADRVVFQPKNSSTSTNNNKTDKMPNNEGHEEEHNLIISGHDWIKFNKFVNNSGLKLIFDLNVLLRDGNNWDNRNAKTLLSFSDNHEIEMDFQLGNEPNSFKHVFNISIPGTQLAHDFESLMDILSKSERYNSSKVIGPDVTRPKNLEEPSLDYLRDFLSDINNLSAISWHQYYFSGRNATLDEFMDPKVLDLLSKQIKAVKGVVGEFPQFSNVPIWLSETSSAYGGGAPGLSDRFVASFLWLDKLGLAARTGIKVVIRQSLYGSYYSLIDENLFPLPDFWISAFYKTLVGRNVLHVRFPRQHDETRLRLYSHCFKRNRNVTANVVLFGINVNNISEYIIPGGLKTHNRVTSFIFTSDKSNLTSKSIFLNGRRLRWEDIKTNKRNIFKSKPSRIPLHMPPYSLAFWVFHGKREEGKICLSEIAIKAKLQQHRDLEEGFASYHNYGCEKHFKKSQPLPEWNYPIANNFRVKNTKDS